MTTKEYNEWLSLAALGLCPDEENPIFIFNSTNKDLLMDIISGKIDAIELAKKQMQDRGLDIKTGRWIGWRVPATTFK